MATAETALLWNDSTASIRILPGVTGSSGGENPPPMGFATFWDESQKPAQGSSEDDEFESTDFDPRWVLIGTWSKGGVARGEGFTLPTDTARYTINEDRPSFLMMQPVAEIPPFLGQGFQRRLLLENRDGENAPPNWLVKLGFTYETDLSSQPTSADSTILFLLANKLPDDTLDFQNAVGFFIATDYDDADLPVKLAMVTIIAPDDLDLVGEILSLPALPSMSQIKLHKVGTTYRGRVDIDGRSVQLGEISLPTINPTVYGMIMSNLDTPNTILGVDYLRHRFVATEAE